MSKYKIFAGSCVALLMLGSASQVAAANEEENELEQTIEDCFVYADDDSYNVVFDNGDEVTGLTILNNGREIWSSDDPRSWWESDQQEGYSETRIAFRDDDSIVRDERSHFSLRTFAPGSEAVSERTYCGSLNTVEELDIQFPNPSECSVSYDEASDQVEVTFPYTPFVNIWSNGEVVAFNDVDDIDTGNVDGVSTFYVRPNSLDLDADVLHFGVQSGDVASAFADDTSRTYCGSIPSSDITSGNVEAS